MSKFSGRGDASSYGSANHSDLNPETFDTSFGPSRTRSPDPFTEEGYRQICDKYYQSLLERERDEDEEDQRLVRELLRDRARDKAFQRRRRELGGAQKTTAAQRRIYGLVNPTVKKCEPDVEVLCELPSDREGSR